MSKRTITKLGRMFGVELENGAVKNVYRKEKTDAPAPRERYNFEYAGVQFSVLVSEGQIINPKKAYKRWKKEEEKRLNKK